MPAAFFRLLLRPINLFMLFVLFWAVLGPGLVIGADLGDRVLADLRVGAPTDALLHYALILGITLPAAFGFIAASASLELQYTRMSWMLPGLSRQLTIGIVAFMIPPAAIVAWITTRAAGSGLGTAAFTIALFWFAAMLHVPDAGAGGTRLVLGGSLIAFMFRPEWYVFAVTAQPAAIATVALLVAAALVRAHTSRRRRRRRMDLPSVFQPVGTLTQLYRRAGRGTDALWRQCMVGASATAWVRAAAYEMTGSFSHGRAMFVAGHAVGGAIAYLFSPTVLLAISFNLAFNGVQLRGGMSYPLSRRQRAHVLFIGNFLDIALLTGIAGASAALLALLGIPPVSANRHPPFAMAMSLALIFAVGPIAQWARARGPLSLGAEMRMGPHVVFAVLTWFAALLSILLVVGNTPSYSVPGRFLVIAGLVAASQALHLVRLRRFYAVRDLA